MRAQDGSMRRRGPVSTLVLVASLLLAANAQAQDSDGDGVANDLDNCTTVANPNQFDADCDRFGNACDPDFDNNSIVSPLDPVIFNQGPATNTSWRPSRPRVRLPRSRS